MTARKRKLPRLPPPWIRRATWVHAPEDGTPAFLFPALSPQDEARELARLDSWLDIDANARTLADWMDAVAPYQSSPACACPRCAADREGKA
jgi:hypothetical protein